MIKPIVIALAATAAVLGATAARAGGVSWSVSIDAPVVVAQPVAAQGYYVDSFRSASPAFERGYRVGAPVPRYEVVAAPVYVRPAPVFVAAPLPVPVYHAEPFRRGHRPEVIVVPAPRWRHHHGWHDDRGFGRGFVHHGDR